MRRPRKFVLALFAALLGLCAAPQAAAPQAAAPRKIMSLSYSPSGVATEAQILRGFSEATLRADLIGLVPHTAGIRTYSLANGLDKVPAIAGELGLKVSLGVGLGKDRGKNAAEIARAIKLLSDRPAAVTRVYVGNEAIIRGDLSPAQLMAYIADVRARLPMDIKLEITTAEPWHVWLKNPELGGAVDMIGAHIFPFHNGVPVADGMRDFDERYAALTKAFPGKRIIIAETGWPLAGTKNQAAVAAVSNAATFLRKFLGEAAARHYDYNIVEAYDQPWKAPEEQGAVWGVLDNSGKPKFDF